MPADIRWKGKVWCAASERGSILIYIQHRGEGRPGIHHLYFNHTTDRPVYLTAICTNNIRVMNGVRDPWNTASINSLGESVSKIANDRRLRYSSMCWRIAGLTARLPRSSARIPCFTEETRLTRSLEELASSWKNVFFDRRKMGMINSKWLINDKRVKRSKYGQENYARKPTLGRKQRF